MKTYFRNSDGQFCSAAQFFAQAQSWSIDTNDSFPAAEKHLIAIRDSYNDNRTAISLLVMGAKKVQINGCGTWHYVMVSPNRYGDVTIQSHVLATQHSVMAPRAETLAAVFAEIERIIAIQQAYADRSSATFVDIP